MKLTFRRRSGKTTRTIDDAIQKLFTNSEIWIPSKTVILEFNNQNSQKKNQEIKDFSKFSIIDDDWELDSFVQIGLIKRIINRLENEHSGNFKVIREIPNLVKIITANPFKKN